MKKKGIATLFFHLMCSQLKSYSSGISIRIHSEVDEASVTLYFHINYKLLPYSLMTDAQTDDVSFTCSCSSWTLLCLVMFSFSKSSFCCRSNSSFPCKNNKRSVSKLKQLVSKQTLASQCPSEQPKGTVVLNYSFFNSNKKVCL